MQENNGHSRRLNATGIGLNPGAFPVGSLESRAAVRSILEAQRTSQGSGTMFRVAVIGNPADPNRKCTCKMPPAGIFALCRCFC